MKLRNKKTGYIGDFDIECYRQRGDFVKVVANDVPYYEIKKECGNLYYYDTLAEFNEEWEDYEPVEPIFDEKIRKAIRAWWDMQDNPFEAAAVLCGKEKDLDGFYHWRIFGYIKDGEQKESTDLCFRTKKMYDYNPSHDYTKEELCGEEAE